MCRSWTVGRNSGFMTLSKPHHCCTAATNFTTIPLSDQRRGREHHCLSSVSFRPGTQVHHLSWRVALRPSLLVALCSKWFAQRRAYSVSGPFQPRRSREEGFLPKDHVRLFAETCCLRVCMRPVTSVLRIEADDASPRPMILMRVGHTEAKCRSDLFRETKI